MLMCSETAHVFQLDGEQCVVELKACGGKEWLHRLSDGECNHVAYSFRTGGSDGDAVAVQGGGE